MGFGTGFRTTIGFGTGLATGTGFDAGFCLTELEVRVLSAQIVKLAPEGLVQLLAQDPSAAPFTSQLAKINSTSTNTRHRLA